MDYDVFSEFYDKLTDNVDYENRAQYILRLFKKYGSAPSLLLDLACGTGSFSLSFAKKGIEVIGVDPSPEMLSIAQNKSVSEGLDVFFLCQKAEELNLMGTVDGIICCLDSLNHITDYKNLCKAFEKAALYLESGGLFVFDVNTVYKHQKVLSGETFVFDEDDIYCVWQNSECDSKNRVDIKLDFFTQNENGTFNRVSEEFSERAYDNAEIQKALQNSGFETLEILGDMSENQPTETEERIYYVAKRK